MGKCSAAKRKARGERMKREIKELQWMERLKEVGIKLELKLKESERSAGWPGFCQKVCLPKIYRPKLNGGWWIFGKTHEPEPVKIVFP